MKGSNKRKSFVEPVGINGSNFKNETFLRLSLPPEMGEMAHIGNRMVSSIKMSRDRLVDQHRSLSPFSTPTVPYRNVVFSFVLKS